MLPHGGIVRADLDGDGEEAWVIGYGDGSLHFLSDDGSQTGVPYTGMRLSSLKRLRRPGGELLLTGTHRGVTAWAGEMAAASSWND